MKNTTWLALAMAGLMLIGCAPKSDSPAVAALKREKNTWERESNGVAEDATTNVEEAAEKANEEAEEI